MEVGESCDPNDFYADNQPAGLRDLSEAAFYLRLVVGSITLCLCPFIIVSPFVIGKLGTTLRRIIAMISLADAISTVCQIVEILHNKSWGEYQDGHNGTAPWECKLNSVFLNGGFYTSVMWSMLLLVFVLYTVNNWRCLSSNTLYVSMQVLGWGYGVVLSAAPFVFTTVQVNRNYLIPTGCQIANSFVVEMRDGQPECLLDKRNRIVLIAVAYATPLLVTMVTVVLFLLILRREWVRHRQVMTSSDGSGHQAAAAVTASLVQDTASGGGDSLKYTTFNVNKESSREVMRCVIKLSITGLIYVLAIVPICGQQLFQIYHGPVRNNALQYTLLAFFAISPNIIGTGNVLLYGVFSKVFRDELVAAVQGRVRRRRRSSRHTTHPGTSFIDSSSSFVESSN